MLIAYLFDLSSSRTKIPSVILLLLLGWLMKQLAKYFGFVIPDLSPALPVLGTIGLILIVLEGSLELELKSSKAKMIVQSFFTALLPMFALAFGFAYILQNFGYADVKTNLVNVIPICVISSAIAIPSVRALTGYKKEFVIYESSFSDIIGVLFFNFVALNSSFGYTTFGYFLLDILLIIIVSFLATLALAFLLNKIEHHIKFVPIILLIILIYAVSKVYHLPALVFILFFGLFIGNLDEIKHLKWVAKLKPEELNREIHKFKDLVIEGAFLIRAVFFILFGYLIESSELLNGDTFLWAVGVTTAIFLLRLIQLKAFRIPLSPLFFIAPRGLITILLFLSINPADQIAILNKSFIIQVIVLTALIMMIGLMLGREEKKPLINNDFNQKDAIVSN